MFASCGNAFVFEVFANHFIYFLQKNIHANNVAQTVLGRLYHSSGTELVLFSLNNSPK